MFAPLIYLVDGMVRKEAKASEKRVALSMAMKYDRRCSEIVGFFQRSIFTYKITLLFDVLFGQTYFCLTFLLSEKSNCIERYARI